MKKISVIGILVGAAVLCAAPISLHQSQDKGVSFSVDKAQARIGRPLTPGKHRWRRPADKIGARDIITTAAVTIIATTAAITIIATTAAITATATTATTTIIGATLITIIAIGNTCRVLA